MRKLLSLLLLATVLAGCGGVKAAPPAPAEPPAKAVDPRLVTATNRFGFDLLKGLQTGENAFISPVSASLALSLTANGANGPAREGILKGLRYESMTMEEINQANAALQTILANPEPKVELSVANGIWHARELKPAPAFLDLARSQYRAEVRETTFGTEKALEAINGWTAEKTKGKIRKLLNETRPDDVMVLVNAIYFKAPWQKEFLKSNTRDGDFHKADGSLKRLPFMMQGGRFSYLKDEGVQGVRLPYGDGRLALYVLMPDRWEGFVDGLTPERWDGWIGRFAAESLILRLPRVKLEYQAELGGPLEQMGMAPAFAPGPANFSGLFAGQAPPTAIRRVVQKTYLDLNEQGTEAAAATAVVATATSAPANPPKQLAIDRPFVLAIRDEVTGVLLFVGSVVEP